MPPVSTSSGRKAGVGLPVVAAALLLMAPATAAAQQPRVDADTAATPPTTTVQTLPGILVDRLPTDRVEDALRLEPGVTEAPDSLLSIRGGQPGDYALYLDGIPVNPGLRRLDGATAGTTRGIRALPGTNALEHAAVWTGLLPASLGHSRAGAVSLFTRQADSSWHPALSFAGDGLFANSLGYNRVEGSLSGPLGRLQLFAAGVLEGQKSEVTGFDAADAPIFVQAGIDTTVAVPSVPFDPASDTTAVPVYDFAVTRGKCDQFSDSPDEGIAGNFGVDCSAARTPESAVGSYRWLATARLPLGDAGGLEFLALNSQDQRRDFDYSSLYNPEQRLAARRTAAVYGLVFDQAFTRRGRSPMRLRAYLSAQRERSITGPLTQEGAASTVDPFGGFLLAPLDFRFDFQSFPVDDELIGNIRLNQPGTRRNPYDLENADQYNVVDLYRNNAYGLLGFSESGGPLGPVRLAHEHRWVAGGELGWRVGASQHLTVGSELTRYDVSLYHGTLASLAGTDAYRERPSQLAAWLEDVISSRQASLALGVRYDRFDSHAERPSYLNPATGELGYFPRIFSAPGFDPADPTAAFAADRAHHAWSARIRGGYRVNPRTELRASFGRQAELPDFGALYAGINTDLTSTSANAAFGSDLGFEKSDLFELGLRLHAANGSILDIAGYQRNTRNAVAPRLTGLYDPTRNVPTSIWIYTDAFRSRVRGIDVRLEQRMGPLLTGLISYSYQQARAETSVNTPSGLTADQSPLPYGRPHALAVTLAYYPRAARSGAASNPLLRGLGAYATFRLQSGGYYGPCSSDAVISSESCALGFSVQADSGRLPTTRQLDLRVTKALSIGGRSVTVYLDARNVLNTRNILAVFRSSGTTASAGAAGAAFTADSAALANQAKYNYGVYDGDSGAIDLTFGGAGRSGCADFIRPSGEGGAPDCLYLLEAEQRWGNGDGVFTVAEQQRASEAYFNTRYGAQTLTGSPRRIRLGLEIGL